jgi:hypothetical protein
MSKEKKQNIYEKYEVVTIHRSKLLNAPYNPRKITDENRKKLKDNVENVGLFGGIVWNIVTGNIVAGHQRVSVLDSLMRTKDYELRVNQIVIDERTEKEQNIFMNNSSAMGDFDFDMIGDMIGDINLELAGFSGKEITELFGNVDIINADDDDLINASDRYQEGKAHRERMKNAGEKQENSDFYITFIFPSNDDKEKFRKKFNLSSGDFQNGILFMENID